YKVYNHETGEELTDVVFTEDYPQVAYQPNDQYGNARTPWFVYFVRSNNGYTLDVTPYGSGEGNYYLIASPVGAVSPADVDNMLSNAYDLYYFDQSAEDGLEWINYQGPDGGYSLQPGKGYLYANSGDETGEVVTLTFNGDAYTGTGTFDLDYDANAEFPGWNLVGNPYAVPATVNRDFYVMNEEGTEIITGEGNTVAAMTGIFVKANGEGESVTFNNEQTEVKHMQLTLNLSNGINIIDRAIVRFNNGSQLPKFMLNQNNTKLYIAQGEDQYAVACNDNRGETNVNFEAAENGIYTLYASVEHVNLDYLHLIDVITGTDIDLLATPSYTFEATTNDNPARFRIVLGIATAVNEENSSNFAFYNNGSLILNIEGNATLNIVDVLGRTISSQSINGNEHVGINVKAGVYTLQLIQGNKIQTQKIVIE
ncbi:MAG: T9SS type A sorting domain-containing protein, partial [Bacteroidales bacterium]|nr:T9SS type A sorting domain-containing protein [Bacteroidales bacterium]